MQLKVVAANCIYRKLNIMKKSLLALAIIAASTTANAATVYDKDGTSLAVGGRVQAVVYNGKAASDVGDGIADHDAGLVNSARLNIEGNTDRKSVV